LEIEIVSIQISDAVCKVYLSKKFIFLTKIYLTLNFRLKYNTSWNV